MATLRLVCPYCLANTRLQLQAPVGVRKPKAEEVAPVLPTLFSRFSGADSLAAQPVLDSYFRLFHSLAHCPECNDYSSVKGVIFGDETAFAGPVKGEAFEDKVTVLRHSPKPVSELPQEIPKEVADVLVELEEDLAAGRNKGRILAGCRSVLDVCLKLLDGGTSGTRASRIGGLASKGLLTVDIGEWAKRLWIDGNDGVHELKADGHPVEEHLKFLRVFVEVAFAIPARIRSGQI